MPEVPFTGSPVFNAAHSLPGSIRSGSRRVRSRDAARVLEFFAKLPDSGTRNFAYTVLGGFYDMADYEQRETDAFLADCANREQGSSTLSILYANGLISRGWAVRGEKGARAVSRDQFASFPERLGRAEEVLRRVTAEYPGDVNAWTTRMLTAR
ncbi:hypothetical protein, partial [Mycobacterium sp.]|uniref:hypothetical protein n=1 Tax=Mycobacterium sp. TaxID=1785 RepID=UPI00260E56DB